MNLATIILYIIFSCLVCSGLSFFIVYVIKDKSGPVWLKSITISLQVITFIALIVIISAKFKIQYDKDVKKAYYHGVSIKTTVYFDNENNIEKADTVFYID
jgi:hypothetical protein